jgi:hypothetical protein
VKGLALVDPGIAAILWSVAHSLSKISPVAMLHFKTSSVINIVLHQPNALIYLKNTKIFFKILDKKPLHMFRFIDKPSSGGVTTACFYKTRTHIGLLLRSIVITISH